MDVTTASKIRVLLVDDQPVFLAGIEATIIQDSRVTVVGRATSGAATLPLIDLVKPDIIVMDMLLSDMGGVSLALKAMASCSRCRIVFLSSFDDQVSVNQAFHAGAQAFVLKRSPETVLLAAIHSAYAGEIYVDAAIQRRATMAVESSKAANSKPGPLPRLTDRERDVVKLIAFGFTNKEVAAKLGVTIKSVETYKTRAISKLNLRSRTKIVQYALLQGWFHHATRADPEPILV